MTFEFATAGRIVFGEGCARGLAAEASRLGERALVVTGRTPSRHAALTASLAEAGLEVTLFPVAGEPTVEAIRSGVAAARESGAETVIAIGGGSAMDAAKAIAAIAPGDGDIMDHLEVIGGAKPLEVPPLPCIAVPTTAGTGSEVTRNSVIASPEHGVKASLRGPFLLPRLVLVDPSLSSSLPPKETAACGMDALTQLVEPFLSARANPFVDALCRDGIRLAGRYLGRAVEDGSDMEARSAMALAALMSGMALAGAGLGAVHGLAAAVGGMFPGAPHGAVCAALLPRVLAANWHAVRSHGPAALLAKFKEAAALITGDPHAPVEEAIECLPGLAGNLPAAHLGSYGIGDTDLEGIARRAANASSMKGNPVDLSHGDLVDILRASL